MLDEILRDIQQDLFDLGSLLGGGDLGLGLGELQIVEMRPVFDENGEPREGVANLSVRIF